MFLSVLADGLSLADEPLLEAALDDRAAEVRSWAAYLLARLPGSALGQRMAERALGCLRLDRGISGDAPGRQPAGRMRCRHAAGRDNGLARARDARSWPARLTSCSR